MINLKSTSKTPIPIYCEGVLFLEHILGIAYIQAIDFSLSNRANTSKEGLNILHNVMNYIFKLVSKEKI